MSLLTTAQLTFCDLKDSYSIHMDTDCIGVACNNDGTVSASQVITIKYRAIMGSSRVDASCEITDLPNGVILGSSSPTSSSQDGTIVLKVGKGSTLNNQQSSNIKAVFTITGSEGFTFEKYITFVKYMTGASGDDAITFKIYSNQGFVFKEDMDEIELRVAAFKGGSVIDDATFTWKMWDDSTGEYVVIVENTSDTSFVIHRGDQYANASIQCVMSYDGNVYEDYVSLVWHLLWQHHSVWKRHI